MNKDLRIALGIAAFGLLCYVIGWQIDQHRETRRVMCHAAKQDYTVQCKPNAPKLIAGECYCALVMERP